MVDESSRTQIVPSGAGVAVNPVAVADLSVVVCAFSMARLELTVAAVAALAAQDPAPSQIVVVVDYNEPLRALLAERVKGAEVFSNEEPRGLSGARNTGLRHSTASIVAFVDDDAEAAPGWSRAMLAAFSDTAVVGVGGVAVPSWDHGVPAWFPEELLWAVGCSYRGQADTGEVRNPLGCNMAFRGDAIRSIGAFDPTLGRLGTLPFGCEETELCVRLRAAARDARIIITRDSVVHHHVPAERSSLRYVWQRSYYEGIGKSMLRRLSSGDSLGTERSYALRVLPGAVLRDLGGLLLLRAPGTRIKRISAIVGSLGLAGIGYVVGLVTRPAGPAAEAQERERS